MRYFAVVYKGSDTGRQWYVALDVTAKRNVNPRQLAEQVKRDVPGASAVTLMEYGTGGEVATSWPASS